MNRKATRFHRILEEAALAAWPAAVETLYDGWLLRCSNGYTKRANSANPLYEGVLSLVDKVSYVEDFYRKHRLPPTFRLTPFAPPQLDPILQARNYTRLDLTHVLARSIEPDPHPLSPPLSLAHASRAQWLETFNSFSSAEPDSREKHAAILERIQAPALFGLLHVDGHPVACGLAVVDKALVGLFDLITAPMARRQGYGTRLVTSLIDWARTQGATKAYLQVMPSNRPARDLYDRLGFKLRYRYWYRRLDR